MISITKVANIFDATLLGSSEGRVKYLLTDSRNLTTPENVLFFAITGSYHNGHLFIPSLIKQGVLFFVVSEKPKREWTQTATFLHVSNSTEALQKLAAWWRKQFNIPAIGITGSNGKTIVKEWLAQCIGNSKRLTRSPGSYNSQIGVPLSVWMLNSDAELGLFEAGISKPGEMEKLRRIIQPTIGVFTNIGDAHQINFDSYEEKIIEKLKLFSEVDTLIYRKQNNAISNQIEKQFKINKLFSWSFETTADVNAEVIQKETLIVTHKNKTIKLVLPFQDNASIENLMHTIATLLYLQYDSAYIKDALAQIRTIPMRLEQKAGNKNNTIINDSYNSDLGSLANALDFLSTQNQHSRKILILSDILESGFSRTNLYKEVAQLINNHNIDLMIGIGSDISLFTDLFHTERLFFKSTEDAIEQIEKISFDNATILLKGSRIYHFETIDKILEAKTHRTVLEVNLNTLTNNLNYYKSLISDKTGIIAMVKAFSYGSGSHEIANILQHNGVAYLAVAFADEGFELRRNGIKTPIMVMNPDEADFEKITSQGIEPVVFELQMLEQIGEYAMKQNLKNVSIHLKLNTGMNRSGFNTEQISSIANYLKTYKSLNIKTAFSHLAASDEPMHDNFTHQQAQTFAEMTTQLEQQVGYTIKKHLLNSAGIERFSQYQFDYVRLGIGLYGVSVDSNKTQQAGRLKTRIAQVREVQTGETVGYNRKGKVTNTSRIATIPIGYADGYRRSLSNGHGKVSIQGKLYPVIGNICMDMTMIDITGTDFKEGDEVIIFGPELPITELAKWIDTIPYEILTSISARVKRIYIKE